MDLRLRARPGSRARACALLIATCVFTALIASSGCGGDSGPGYLWFGTSQGIVKRAIEDGSEQIIARAATATTTLRDPAPSPDGKRIVYVFAPPFATANGRPLVTSDIWIMDRDGSNARVLYAHAGPGDIAHYPLWLDDKTLLVVFELFDYDTGVAKFTLASIDVESGARTDVRVGVTAFGLSKDRKQLVFALREGVKESLRLVNFGSTSEQVVVAQDKEFGSFTSPRFTPDGKAVVFSASENTSAAASERYVSVAAMAPVTHGTPQDVYSVDLATLAIEKIAPLTEDNPGVVFVSAGDGLFAYGFAALYAIDTKSRTALKLRDTGGVSGISWTAK